LCYILTERSVSIQELEIVTRDPADTRERILACAADLFGKQGFEAVTVANIASSCDISTSLIYYHFDDKESLLAALNKRISAELIEPAVAILTGEGSARERLELFIEEWVAATFETPDFVRIHIRPFTDPESPLAAERLKAASSVVEALASVIAEGIETEEFDPVDPVFAAECLFGLVNTRATAGAIGAPHDRLVEADAEQTSAFIMALFMEGICSC
jgi:AcrR family transcriptional regulator